MSKSPMAQPRKRKKSKLALGALSILIAAVGAQPPQGNQSPRPAPQEGESPLQLRISTPTATLVQCEPVPVKFELKNVSDKTLSVDLSLEPMWGLLLVYVTPPGEDRYLVEPRGVVSGDGAPRELGPHGSVAHGRLLHHNWKRGFHFKGPGQYRVEARYRDLRSNTLVLSVVEAKGDDAKALEEHWGCNPVGQFMMGATSDYVIAREFEAVLNKYPTSVYAPWCELALAKAESRRAGDDAATRKRFGVKEISFGRTERAIKQYQRFTENHPEFPFPYSVSMPYTVAKMKLFLGRKEEALREIEALFEKHPEVDFIKEAKFKIDLFAELGRELTSGELP